jgi:hypothetical protein
LALKSISNDISPDKAKTTKTHYNNEAMLCFANDEKSRDFYARIEGAYNYGRFKKEIEVSQEGKDDYMLEFYCCFRYDYLEVKKLPTDFERPSDIAQAVF